MKAESFFKSGDGMRNAERLYHRNASIALSVAITLHCMMVTGYYLYVLLAPVEPIPVRSSPKDTIWVVKGTIMVQADQPENPIIRSKPRMSRPAMKPNSATFGIPVPEPFIDSSSDFAFEPFDPQDDGGVEGRSGEAVNGDREGVVEEAEPSPDAPHFVEKEPIPIRQSVPGYPEFARRLGIEGTVWVKILVDKDGRARRALVAKSDNSMLDDSAKAAALRWLFTPAMMTNGPVMVWAAVPFRFRLEK